MILMAISGEIEYGEIFFKDKPPLNFGDQWDQDWFKVPFPFITYSMFIAFVIAVTFLAFNVLVGLTVDDIRKFLGNADLRKLSMRLEQISWIMTKEKGALNRTITKRTTFEARIWKEVENRKIRSRKIGRIEEELSKTQSKIKDLKEIITNTNTVVAEIKSSIAEMKCTLQQSNRSR